MHEWQSQWCSENLYASFPSAQTLETPARNTGSVISNTRKSTGWGAGVVVENEIRSCTRASVWPIDVFQLIWRAGQSEECVSEAITLIPVYLTSEVLLQSLIFDIDSFIL